MRRQAFTLIELLVVISIVALLIGILLPVLSSGRAMARTSSCLSLVRQYSTSWNVMTVDNSDELTGYGSGENIIHKQLDEYIPGQEAGILVCADTEVPAKSTWATAANNSGRAKIATIWNSGVAEPYVTSYAFNNFLFNNTLGANGGTNNKGGVWWYRPYWPGSNLGLQNSLLQNDWFGSNLSHVPLPSSTPIFGDAKTVDAWTRDVLAEAQDGGAGSDESSGAWWTNDLVRFQLNRHKGMVINLGFVDGHAQGVFVNDLWQFKWSKSFVTKEGSISWAAH